MSEVIVHGLADGDHERYYLDEDTSRGSGQREGLGAESTKWCGLRSQTLHTNAESPSMSSQP